MNKPRVVVCAAICNRLTSDVICGSRHYDETMGRLIFMHAMQQGWSDAEQGFIDQFGVFMTREEAWEVACAAGQIKYVLPNNYGQLFSENLY